MEFVPFIAEHLHTLEAQPAQSRMSAAISPELAVMLEKQSSFTALDEGRPVGAAGVLTDKGTHRGMAWAFLSVMPARKFILVHRAVKSYLDGCYIPRLEMTVECDFEAGHRWAKLLGFTLEAERMRAWTADLVDVSLYARIK